MGRPSFQVTDEQRKWVRTMASLGIPQDDIALLLEVTPKTLRKHFRKELTHGAIEANAKVMETLFAMATSGKNTAATIFYAKTRCGLREKPRDETRSAPQPKEAPPQIVISTDKANDKA